MTVKIIGVGKQPLICAPLIGKTREAIFAELAAVLAKKPDVVEWRADYFSDVSQTDEVILVGNKIKEVTGDISVIFTVRSTREGGQPVSLMSRDVIELQSAVCKNTPIEYVDCELSNKKQDIEYLRQVARTGRTKIIASYHNFDHTPDREFLKKKFDEAELSGLDVAKVAVMSNKPEDVLTLLTATLEAKQRLNIPVISVSMGGIGVVTRMIGGIFGSSLTFAVGEGSSAPGQIPIGELKTVLGILRKFTDEYPG